MHDRNTVNSTPIRHSSNKNKVITIKRVSICWRAVEFNCITLYSSTQWILGQLTFTCSAYINDNSLVQQALFLGSHYKVMRVVPVVHNVLQIDTCNKWYGLRMVTIERAPAWHQIVIEDIWCDWIKPITVTLLLSHLSPLWGRERTSGWRWRPRHWSLLLWPLQLCSCWWSWLWWRSPASPWTPSFWNLREKKIVR